MTSQNFDQSPQSMKTPITILVHTLNEEVNLPYSLRSVIAWADQVILVDSDSTDRTQDIARSFGVDIMSRPCTRRGLVAQRNWALEQGPIRNEWVFILDADEEMSTELIEEVDAIVHANSPAKDAYWCRFKIIFEGRWTKRSSLYPTWSLRLFRHAIVRYEQREVNAHPVVAPGKEGYLKHHFLTEDRKPFRTFVDRMNDFSDLESIAYASILRGENAKGVVAGRFFGGHAERRRWMKNLYIKMPMRPAVIFLYLYIFRMGFLEGNAGLDFALYKAMSEWLTGLKSRERIRISNDSTRLGEGELPQPYVRSERV